MPDRLFLFLQLELPWELGPPDGRYLLRTRDAAAPAEEVAAPERVIVLGTLGAARRVGSGPAAIGLPRIGSSRRARRARDHARTLPGGDDPRDDRRSRFRLRRAAGRNVARGNRRRTRNARGHRRAQPSPVRPPDRRRRPLHPRGDPRPGACDPAGWGEGEQVADGDWLYARELPWVPSSRMKRRAAVLRPQERLAELLGARGEELLCEELALRARLDLDQGRLPLAAHELDAALTAAERELGEEANPALAPRVDELRALHAGIDDAPPEEEQVRHALERLEAALRARTAGGFSRS